MGSNRKVATGLWESFCHRSPSTGLLPTKKATLEQNLSQKKQRIKLRVCSVNQRWRMVEGYGVSWPARAMLLRLDGT